MRYLGIDYGHKRIGLSYADEVGVAVPLLALVHGNLSEKISEIACIARERKIDAYVVGYPYHVDGTPSVKMKEIDDFMATLNKKWPLPVHYVDESLTSYDAESCGLRGRKRGVRAQKKHRQSGVVDSRAATLILQDFLSNRERA